MQYLITIETDVEYSPGNENHWLALLSNPNNKFRVLNVEKDQL